MRRIQCRETFISLACLCDFLSSIILLFCKEHTKLTIWLSTLNHIISLSLDFGLLLVHFALSKEKRTKTKSNRFETSFWQKIDDSCCFQFTSINSDFHCDFKHFNDVFQLKWIDLFEMNSVYDAAKNVEEKLMKNNTREDCDDDKNASTTSSIVFQYWQINDQEHWRWQRVEMNEWMHEWIDRCVENSNSRRRREEQCKNVNQSKRCGWLLFNVWRCFKSQMFLLLLVLLSVGRRIDSICVEISFVGFFFYFIFVICLCRFDIGARWHIRTP